MRFGVVGESFETSIPWDKCSSLCKNVKTRIRMEAKAYKLCKPFLLTCRFVHNSLMACTSCLTRC